MKIVKKLTAILLCATLIALTLVGCHGKDAKVATYTVDKKTYSVPSGVYLVALILADSDTRNIITERVSKAGGKLDDIDFEKQTITNDDKKEVKFYDYVLDKAKKTCREYIYIDYYFNKYGLKLTDSDKSSMNYYIDYQWNYAGYSYLCDKNGASHDSFSQFMKVYAYERDKLFSYLYDNGGKYEPDADEITKSFTDNFAVADTIQISTVAEDGSTALSNDEITAIQNKLQGYADRINNGKATFAQIKAEYDTQNAADSGSDATSSAAASSSAASSGSDSSDAASSEENEKPIDENATVYGSSDTSVSNDLYTDIVDCEYGKATVVDLDTSKVLVLRSDITADPYYLKKYRSESIRLLKSDDYTDYLEKQSKKLDIKFDSYEINYLKPKKLDYTDYTNWYNQTNSNAAAGTASIAG